MKNERKKRVVYNQLENDPWRGKDFVATLDEETKEWRVCLVCSSERVNCINGEVMRYELLDEEDCAFDSREAAEAKAKKRQCDYNEAMVDLVGGMN